MKKVFLFSFIFFSIFILSACSISKKLEETKTDDIKLVGNDLDIYGCKASAGYSWCEEKDKCLRVWEESCQDSIDDFIKELNENNNTNLTFLGKKKFNWRKENENKELFGARFFDLKINQEKLNKLLNYIEKNTETSIENQADSSKSSMVGFRHNLDICQLTYEFNNIKENELGVLKPENSERNLEIICTMYK